MKYDGGKLRFDLIDGMAEAELVAVLTYGAVKYDAENWRKVDDAENRYFAALRRHLDAFRRRDEQVDPESGLHHLAHAAACLHFMLALAAERHPALAESFDNRLARALETARAMKEKRQPTSE